MRQGQGGLLQGWPHGPNSKGDPPATAFWGWKVLTWEKWPEERGKAPTCAHELLPRSDRSRGRRVGRESRAGERLSGAGGFGLEGADSGGRGGGGNRTETFQGGSTE